MRVWLQAVGEEVDDASAAEFSRRQADGVDDDEIDRAVRGPLVAVGRRHIVNAFDDPPFRDARSNRQLIFSSLDRDRP